MKTYNITINNLTFEELKETVQKLGDSVTSGTVTETPKAPTAASVMAAPTPEVVAAPKAAPAKKSKKAAQEPAVPLFVPDENEEMESVPSPYAPSQPVSEAQPTVQVAHSAPIQAAPVVHAPAFDRAATIDSINATVAALSNKLQNIEAVRAVINDTYVSLGMNAEPMTKLPDDKMAVVYKAFFNKAQGILNGNLADALV